MGVGFRLNSMATGDGNQGNGTGFETIHSIDEDGKVNEQVRALILPTDAYFMYLAHKWDA